MNRSVRRSLLVFVSALALVSPVFAQKALPGLAGKWVLVIRHGEKPESGTGLTPAGEARAKAYVNYFSHYLVNGKPLKIGRLIATKDGKNSWRERLTLEPLGKATGIPLEMEFKNKEAVDMVAALNSTPKPGNILICWHHGQIPNMLTALGANASSLIGAAKWPDDHFDWVIQLHYDRAGSLISKDCKKVVEPKF